MRYLTTSLIALLAAVAATASADEEAPLYRVELVVFVNTDTGTGEEGWPQPQGLAYPEHWRVLDANELAASDFDPFSAPESTQESDTTGQDASASASVEPDNTELAADADTAPADADADIDEEESPAWRSLPESDWLLADSANRIARSGRYQVVLHQAWLQPLGNRDEHPALILAGGERFGNHHELEGFLSLRQERYIHVDAQLWLSRFRFGSGLEATLFSPLPTPPHRMRPVPWSYGFGDPEREPVEHSGLKNAETETADLAAPLVTHRPFETMDSGWMLGTGTGTGTGIGFGSSPRFGITAGFEDNYVPSQIFVLKQRQRVEPDQLTYLDHPLIGALLLVKPVPAATEP